MYRLLAGGIGLGALGFVLVGATMGVGEPGVVAKSGLALLGAGFAMVGYGLVRYREPVAATDSRYDYGPVTIATFGVVAVAAGVALGYAAVVA